MRCVVQRVISARLTIDNQVICSIPKGIVILVGFKDGDNEEIIDYVLEKLINLRIFEDEYGKMNLSVKDIDANIMIVPNFTLYADIRKGRRPDFMGCAKPIISEPLYNYTIDRLSNIYKKSCYGVFGAHMKISLVNDGPVTIVYEKDTI